MLGRRQIACVMIGVATASAPTLGFGPTVASAQGLRSTIPGDAPAIPRRIQDAPPAARTPTTTPAPAAAPVPGTRVQRPAQAQQPIDALAGPPVTDAPDGLLNGDRPEDNQLTGAEPAASERDFDPLTDPEMGFLDDRPVFERPPAGFDPELFQAELEPLLDRRPARLARLDPYDPPGIRLGSFILFPELETAGAWSSNVLRSPQAQSDTALELRPTARLISSWRAHALEFRGTGNLSWHNEFPSEDDRTWSLESRGRLDINRRLNIEGLLSRNVTQESRNALDATRGSGDRADVTTDRASVTLNTRFNRLSLQLRGSINSVAFSPVRQADGTIASNQDRNVTTREEAIRATWEFKPTFQAFFETAINQRTHEAPAADAIQRDLTGERLRWGVGFGNTGQKLRGEVSLGYGRQSPDDSRLPSIEGLLFDANLAWRATALTTMLLLARTEVVETSQTGSSGGLSRQVGAEMRHAFRRHLIASAGLSREVVDYSGLALEERDTRATLGVEYYLGREAILFGRYQHTAFRSTDATRGYEADEVRIGVRIRR